MLYLSLIPLTIAVSVQRFKEDTGDYTIDADKGWIEGKCPHWKTINKV